MTDECFKNVSEIKKKKKSQTKQNVFSFDCTQNWVLGVKHELTNWIISILIFNVW